MIRTLEQNAVLHKLLGELGIEPELKSELVFQYTNGRTERSSQMNVEECQALINHLNHIKKEVRPDKEDKMRKKILSICHEMNWKTPQGKIDWDRLNNWMLKYGYLKKRLNEYSFTELPTLVTQFESLLRTYYATLDKSKNGF